MRQELALFSQCAINHHLEPPQETRLEVALGERVAVVCRRRRSNVRFASAGGHRHRTCSRPLDQSGICRGVVTLRCVASVCVGVVCAGSADSFGAANFAGRGNGKGVDGWCALLRTGERVVTLCSQERKLDAGDGASVRGDVCAWIDVVANRRINSENVAAPNFSFICMTSSRSCPVGHPHGNRLIGNGASKWNNGGDRWRKIGAPFELSEFFRITGAQTVI